MNFCVVILIMKMEENKQHFWSIVLYYFKKDKNTTEMAQKMCAVSGEVAVTGPSKVVCRISCWRFLSG